MSNNWKATIFLLAALATIPRASVAAPTQHDDVHDHNDARSNRAATNRNPATDGRSRITQSLFRFPASKLGSVFEDLLQQWYDEWLHVDVSPTNSTPSITPEPAGLSHAFHSVATPATTIFRRQCYGPSPIMSQYRNQYSNFEDRRKEISFQYNADGMEETRLLHTMTKRFYPAFLPDESDDDLSGDTRRLHRKKATSTVNTLYAQTTLPSDYDSPQKLSFETVSSGNINPKSNDTQQWSWHPPAHFSSRGTPSNMPFRQKMYSNIRKLLTSQIQKVLPNFTFAYGRQSGMFWYPPGGVREWHTNRLDLVGRNGKEEEVLKTQVWRMYFVRTVRDKEFDTKLARFRNKKVEGSCCDESSDDHSAMHIIPGKDAGITLDVLQKAGARLLAKDEELRQWSDEFAENYSMPSNSKKERNKNTINGSDDEQFDRNSVWRIPDQDGYVTLFRLPDIWHCIVSEEVHRYSLGFAFSDMEVQALLKLAEVSFDLEENGSEAEHDEL